MTNPVDEMGEERRSLQDRHAKVRATIDAQVREYRAQLEKDAFGLPPFDASKNCTGGFEPPAEAAKL